MSPGERLERDAAEAMARRAFAEAASLLRLLMQHRPARVQDWLGLLAAERAQGRLEAALASADEALRLQPRHPMALLARASLMERLQGERAAAPVYGAALLNAPPMAADAPLARALAHARAVNARYGEEMAAALREPLRPLGLSGAPLARAEAFIDRLAGRRRVYVQEPLGYCYPGLPAIEFWDRTLFPWLGALEAAFPAIQAEMLAVGFEDAALVPYMQLPDTGPLDQWAELNRSPQWNAFHLFERGLRVEANCARCPATLEALASAPQPAAPGRSPSAMFSLLAPRTRIPPHTGVSNTRLVGHLALSVPEGCGFRVGAETRTWREGEAFVFDDTIEHEAWNDSARPRAVLIFDVRHPLIPPEEEAAICAVMAALDRFSAAPPPSAQAP